MSYIYSIALGLHIFSGFSALGTGLYAIISRKGGRSHILSGRFFFILMCVVAFTAVILSLIKPQPFLLSIALFAFYQNSSGYRSVRNKSLHPTWFDWLITLCGLVTGIYMWSTMHTVLLVFGSISLYLSVSDVVLYVQLIRHKKVKRANWLARHIGMMMGAFIATVTAFVVVNVRFVQPEWIPWLLPTIVGVPLMQYWTWKYTRRGQSGKAPAIEKQH